MDNVLSPLSFICIRIRKITKSGFDSATLATDLQSPKLLLFSPVIECCDKNNNNNSQEDGQPLYPVCVVLLLA